MRILKYALKNIKRNAFLSLSSVLVITLIIFFINILLLVNFTTDEIIKNINSRLTITITLNRWYTNENSEVIELISWMKRISNNLLVVYVSSEEALSTMKSRDPELIKVVETEWENPLPESIRIENIWISEYEKLNEVISKYKGIVVYDEKRFKKKITDYKAQYTRIMWIIEFIKLIKIWIYSIIWFFVFSVFIIIYNIIGNFIFFYRDEIKITKLVWWDNIFIYWPFSLQWLIYTLFSTILSLVIYVYIVRSLNTYLTDDFPNIIKNINSFLWEYFRYFIYEIIGISFIWMISWFLSSQKFINKAHSFKSKNL